MCFFGYGKGMPSDSGIPLLKISAEQCSFSYSLICMYLMRCLRQVYTACSVPSLPSMMEG